MNKLRRVAKTSGNVVNIVDKPKRSDKDRRIMIGQSTRRELDELNTTNRCACMHAQTHIIESRNGCAP